MADDVSRLGLEVDSSGVDKAAASLGSFVKAGRLAEEQAKHLDEVLTKGGGKGNKGIDEYIAKLKIQSAQMGRTAIQQDLIALAAKGASEAQLREAKAILETVEAFKKQERAALDAGKAAEKAAASALEARIARAAALGTGIGTVLGQSIGFAARKVFDLAKGFEELTQSASRYKDLEEAFGAPAEKLASIDVAAKVAGTSIETVAEFTAKLTRGLAGVDDETKNAGKALVRLGIDVEKFKTKDPVEQLEILGAALNKFKDGQSKTELIGDLGGRGASRILPFLKELNSEGQRNVIITQEQIDAADNYKDAQARARGTLDQYLKLIALQALPALTAFTGTIVEVAKELLGVDATTGKLKNNTGVRDFAESAVIAFARVVDIIATVTSALALVGRSFAQVFEDVALLGSAAALAGKAATLATQPLRLTEVIADTAALKVQLQQRNAHLKDYNAEFEGFEKRNATKFEDSVRNRIKAGRAAEAEAAKVRAAGDQRPELDKRDAKGKKVKGEKGAATDKDLLGFDISELKDKLALVKAAYSDQESQLEAVHSAGLLDDKDYYALKLRLLRESTEKEIAELQNENAARQAFIDQRKGTEKDRLTTQRDINKTDAQIIRQRESEAAKEFVLEVQRTSALTATERAYKGAQIAAQQYLDTITLQHERELAAFGKGDLAQRQAAGRNQVTDRYQQQRDELEKTVALQRDKEGKLTEFQQTQYDRNLQLIKDFEAKALDEWDTYYGKLLAKEQDAANGFSTALANLADTAGFTAKNVESVTTNAFKGMEDAIVEFATTGKLSFKSMIDQFVKDIIRLTVQQQLIKPIANYLNGTEGGGNPQGIGGSYTSGSSGFGSFVSGLAGLFGSFGGGVGTPNASGSGSYASLAGISGGRAIGGPVSRGGLYRVNEKGPEVLSVAGKHYLMTGGQDGNVTPNRNNTDGRPLQIAINQSFAPGTDKRTVSQAAAMASQQLNRAQRVR